MKKMLILKAFKRKFLLNIILVMVLFVMAAIFSFIGLRYNYNNQNLVNIFGSQRYIIQQLSKESYRIYIYLGNLDNNTSALRLNYVHT